MATYELDALRNSLDSKHNCYVIQVGDEEFVFRSAMRLPKSERQALKKIFQDYSKALEKDDSSVDDLEEPVQEIITKVVADGKGQQLVELIGDDIQLALHILLTYTNESQAGEASGSPTSSTTTASN